MRQNNKTTSQIMLNHHLIISVIDSGWGKKIFRIKQLKYFYVYPVDINNNTVPYIGCKPAKHQITPKLYI